MFVRRWAVSARNCILASSNCPPYSGTAEKPDSLYVTDSSDYIVDLKKGDVGVMAASSFDGVDIRIPRGQGHRHLGPSGMLARPRCWRLIGAPVARPTVARCWSRPEHPATKASRICSTARQHMGMLFQSGALFTICHVFENVAFPLRCTTDLSEDMVRDIVLLKHSGRWACVAAQLH